MELSLSLLQQLQGQLCCSGLGHRSLVGLRERTPSKSSVEDACYDKGAPLFFSNTTRQFGSSRPPPKTVSKKNKTATYRIKKNLMAQVPNENHAKKKKWPVSDDVRLRSPVIPKPCKTKTATSIDHRRKRPAERFSSMLGAQELSDALLPWDGSTLCSLFQTCDAPGISS